MTDETTRQDHTSARRRTVRPLLRGAFPEAISLGFVGLLALAVVGCALFAEHILSDQRDALQTARAQAAAQAVAARLALLAPDDGGLESEDIAAIADQVSAVSVRWVDDQGATRCAWSRGAAGDGRTAGSGVADASAPVTHPDGTSAGKVAVGLRAEADGGHQQKLYTLFAGVLAAAILAYLVLYRFVRRQTRPMNAIQSGLESYAAGIEKELQTLHLSAAFGEMAQGWNQLIEETVDLRRQLSQASQAGAANSGDALSRFENRTLRDMLERLPVGVIRFGAEEQIHYINSSAARYLGKPMDALAGQDVRGVLGSDSNALLDAGWRGARTAVDWERQGPGGTCILRAELLPPTEGVDPESLLLIQDVTDLREVEQARNSFLYHITHELRTPLTNIQAYAETLSRLDFDDEQTRKECYNVIMSETKRLSDLVEDILSISQMEVGAMRLELGDVDMVRLLRTMVQDNLGAADDKGVELTLSMPPKLPKINGDKRRLSVLLNNLIGNAVKYTQRGGCTSVRASSDERRMRIQVTDTGLGIAPEDCTRVFEKFYRVECEQVQNVKGTGLGLAIAREVARLHGGDILLESEPGKGSTFTLELPLRAADAL